MTDDGLVLGRCDACHARFLPTDGPCPRCASRRTRTYAAPPQGAVLAATELSYPPPGWARPHRLALVEVADGVRLLAVVDGELPVRDSLVRVTRAGEIYRAHPPASSNGEGRGEGESPSSGAAGRSFEPPR